MSSGEGRVTRSKEVTREEGRVARTEKRNSKFDHEAHEVHEEKKLTTKAPKVFNQKYPNLRVLRDLRGEKAYDRKTINQ